MKKLKVLALVLVTVATLTSCDKINALTSKFGVTIPEINLGIEVVLPPIVDPNMSAPTPPVEDEEAYINDDITFAEGETVTIVVSEENRHNAYGAQSLATEITNSPAITVTDFTHETTNELVLGKCDRPISKEAYEFLEGIKRENSFIARYAIYSYGNSVALAFDKIFGYDQFLIDYVLGVFSSAYVKEDEPVNLESGELYLGTVDLMKVQATLDAEREEAAWAAFEEEAGEEAAAVLKTMYEKMYSGSLSTWLAGLYDPKEGGFYYSNSARDTEKVYFEGEYYDLLPDIESTAQALGFIDSSGLISDIGRIADALPEEMQKELVKFVKSKQDKNGYFYHPQWTKDMVDSELARRGRDLTSALGILGRFSARPTYNTITGTVGDGLLANGTPAPASALTLPLSSSKVCAVSYVVLTSETVPSHLKDEASFREYLAQFEDENGDIYILNDSYWIGNQLAAQAAQIKGRDEQLKEAGESYTLTGILKEWLKDYCNKDSGTWTDDFDADTSTWKPDTIYSALNGLMKISSVYQSLGIALPYPEASVKTAIASITTTDDVKTVCYAYNSWFAINNIISCVEAHDEKAVEIVGNIRKTLNDNAPELIEATLEKQYSFLRNDGSFSYTPERTTNLSQGLPVAPNDPETGKPYVEGDVNATVICTTGTLEHMFTALGYPKVPILYRSDFNRFLMDIEAKREAQNP